MSLRVGTVILPTQRWATARDLWREADDLGFDSAWTYDHITWSPLADRPWFSAYPTLSAAAAVTSRVRLGALVTSPNFRHPVPLAKEVMTLDDLSGGRAELGIGAGSATSDAAVLGGVPWSPGERTGRFEEVVGLLDLLLTQPRTTSQGSWYSARDAGMLPGCVQQPRVPFTVAASGPRGMRLAARHAATWVTFGPLGRPPGGHPAEQAFSAVRDQLESLDGACAAVGRDPATLRRMLLTGLTQEPWLASPEAFTDLAGRYAAIGVTDLVVHRPVDEPGHPFAGDPATYTRIATEVLPSLRAAPASSAGSR